MLAYFGLVWIVTASPQVILDICAAVAASHGDAGGAIAAAIRRIDLTSLIHVYDLADHGARPKFIRRKTVIRRVDLNPAFPVGSLSPDGKRRKYIYRKTVKGHRYIYFRGPDRSNLTRLPTNESSKEFWKAYLRCWHETKPPE